jgi:hypothetical protein
MPYPSSGMSSISGASSSSSSNGASKWEAAELVGAERVAIPDAFGIDVAHSRFPFAIVWTPIPCLTWLFPFIGHMGICDSRGVAYDFAGPYTIGVDELAFGSLQK